MILTITYTGEDTTDIGYLFYKNPSRPQAFDLNHGTAYVFYPEVTNGRTTIAMILNISPIDLARGKVGSTGRGLFDYVNDRPYVSSSFMSTAISRVFGTAMTGRSDERQALSDSKLPLTAKITMLPCSGRLEMINRVFEPLGYRVSYETFPVDEAFPSWGDGKYVNVTLEGEVRLRDLLKHIYVCIPVFDKQKHYWIAKDEVDKLLRHGADWLNDHPEKAYITGRYLNRKRSLVHLAFDRLADMEEDVAAEDEEEQKDGTDRGTKEVKEERMNLNTRRLGGVVAALKSVGAKTVLDLGCGEGNLLSYLKKESQFEKITGVDVSCQALEKAKRKLNMDKFSDYEKERIRLFQGSLTYKDARLEGYDAACVVEVVEHLDPSRLRAFERVVFGCAKPKYVVLTTPNVEYNKCYEGLEEGGLRHGDHRFEWNRKQFREWANHVSETYGYEVSFSEIGDSDLNVGAPTQMGVFQL